MPPEKRTRVTVFLDDQEYWVGFKQLVAQARSNMSQRIQALILWDLANWRRTGKILDLTVAEPSKASVAPKRIRDFLIGQNLAAVSEQILLPVDNLIAISIGYRPTDEDLIALSAAECVDADIEELHAMRNQEFQFTNGDVCNAKQR